MTAQLKNPVTCVKISSILEKGDFLMLKIALCDDETTYLHTTEKLLREWSREAEIPMELDCFTHGDALLVKHRSSRYDVIFLDIVMPLLSGMDAAKELRNLDKSVNIIFLTSSPEFALSSYSVRALDYLIKPLTYEKLKEVLEECIALLHKEPESLTLKTAGGYRKIYHHDIEYLEAQNKRVLFYLAHGESLEVLQPLHTFETELPDSKGFFKCHRSYLVNLKNIRHFSNVELTTKTGRQIPIARGYGKPFQDAYFAMMFQDQ